MNRTGPTQHQSMDLPPRLPLVVVTSNRDEDTDKDARLVNCYIETRSNAEGLQDLWVFKRPGIEEYADVGLGDSPGRGAFLWQGDTYTVFGTILYRNGVQVATGLSATGSMYSFSSILGATPKMVLGDGDKAYAYTVAGGLTADLHSINIDFPDTFVTGWVYLNGATYVMQPQAVIWGSAINSVSVPGDWSALNFISAQAEPDNGVALAKQLVYVVSFNQWSTEVFSDNGNATGSPLIAVQGAKLDFGCYSGNSLQSIDTKLIWLSYTKAGALQVASMEGLNMKIVSTKAIDRLLEGVDASVVYSWQAKFSGHSFYVITFKNSNLTLAYDVVEDLWCQWTDPDGNYLPYIAAVANAQNQIILQHESNGKLYRMSPTIYNDAGAPIVVDIITPNFDANISRRKQMNFMYFIGDQDVGSVLSVRWNDHDYQEGKWSSFRHVNLNRRLPYLQGLGSFMKRAFHFRHTSNTPFRMKAVDVQYDIGVL